MLPARQWRNRIIGHGEEEAEQLLANPKNWRIHPKAQQEALEGVLREVGWVQDVIVNQRTGYVVDGHARVAMAISRGEKVPVVYVDLDEREEALILATLDPLSAMAGTDKDLLAELLGELKPGEAAVQSVLDQLAAASGIDIGRVGSGSLIEKFGVPPFSVLDARQGYWQERKRAWLELGIQSELGRGDCTPGGGGPNSARNRAASEIGTYGR